MNIFKKHPFFIRLLNWEYWSFNTIYGPIYIIWFWFCLKARSFFFFNAANPTIRNGGFLMDSKKEIYDLIPQKFYPVTLFFTSGTPIENILDAVQKNTMSFPLIGKPDIGMKGIMVKKLNNENELVNYCENIKVDFLIQNNVSYPEEVGIFYYRYPNEENGHISGIVKKEFLSVKGDGISTINELIKQKPRAILQAKTLEKTFGQKLDEVLKKDEKFILVPYGSHFRGSKFIDDSHLIDPKISAQIDSICKQVNGFYFGRLDIRYSTWDELCEGKNFSIIEINGVGSEPTHMYDPGHSLFFAWSEIIRHWRILYRISKQNHKRLKIPYMTTKEGLEMFRQNSKYIKQLTN